MSRRTPYLFEVTYRDGRVERCMFYATTRAEAQKSVEAWARRLGVEVEPVEGEER